VIPYIGAGLVEWIWGGFAVDYPTLTRFFSLHFLFPFILCVFVLLHFIFLHETGSNNPLGLKRNGDKIFFFPLFASKDILGGFMIFFLFLFFFSFSKRFMEYQNFLEAKSLVTPTHIQPEWYFLPAYAVLRSIPNKLGGVIALFLFIVILFFLPFIFKFNKLGELSLRKFRFRVKYQIFYWF